MENLSSLLQSLWDRNASMGHFSMFLETKGGEITEAKYRASYEASVYSGWYRHNFQIFVALIYPDKEVKKGIVQEPPRRDLEEKLKDSVSVRELLELCPNVEIVYHGYSLWFAPFWHTPSLQLAYLKGKRVTHMPID